MNNATIKNTSEYRRRRALHQRERYETDHAYREAKKRRSTEYRKKLRDAGDRRLKRRSRNPGAEWREALIHLLIDRDGRNCQLCGLDIGDEKAGVIDHIVAVVRGGVHRLENFRLTHAMCNLSDSGKLHRKWN